MKVKHAIELSDEEIDTLFAIPVDCLLNTYATAVEQAAALAKAKLDFSAYLQKLVHHSFKYGKKIGKASADEKDTKMYSDGRKMEAM